MNDPRGSVWRKWDLHVHTPASIIHSYGGETVWDEYLDELAALPSEIKVLGINDYIFLDGYKKVLAAKAGGRLPNIDLLLPVIELRLDKFGGSRTGLSKINFHVIFSPEIPIETIESQFLGALCSNYILSPELESLRSRGKWSGVPTRQSLRDLGIAIIQSVPDEEKASYGTPIEEGFNNLCLSLDSIRSILDTPYFKGKALTAVGKTEWADIKWTGQSIAEKKNIINGADFVFISGETIEGCHKARTSLEQSGVNSRLLDCSDAHYFSSSKEKDRLGKCYTWIKADPTFEGLRQTIFEYRSRVQISNEAPLSPLLTIKRVLLDFPADTQLVSEINDEEHRDDFCFRGKVEIVFSPYLTCLIGGRGSGKSTILNLLHEKLNRGGNHFFKKHRLIPQPLASIPLCVTVDWDGQGRDVEFLQQNEIEGFATDSWRLTEAVFSRLAKLDENGDLDAANKELAKAIEGVTQQGRLLVDESDLRKKVAEAEKDLASNSSLIASFQNEEYREITTQLSTLNTELQSLELWKERLSRLLSDLSDLTSRHTVTKTDSPNSYETQFTQLLSDIATAVKRASTDVAIMKDQARSKELTSHIAELKEKLETFLKGRGLSPENLADVGKANERVARLTQEIPILKSRLESLTTKIAGFQYDADITKRYGATVQALLSPINGTLKNLSNEVKPIELHYDFDRIGCRETILAYIHDKLTTRSFRTDHVESMLQGVDVFNLTDQAAFIAAIPNDQKT